MNTQECGSVTVQWTASNHQFSGVIKYRNMQNEFNLSRSCERQWFWFSDGQDSCLASIYLSDNQHLKLKYVIGLPDYETVELNRWRVDRQGNIAPSDEVSGVCSEVEPWSITWGIPDSHPERIRVYLKINEELKEQLELSLGQPRWVTNLASPFSQWQVSFEMKLDGSGEYSSTAKLPTIAGKLAVLSTQRQ